jgi:hypothetical protein
VDFCLFAAPKHTLVQDGQQMIKIASFVISTAEHFLRKKSAKK